MKSPLPFPKLCDNKDAFNDYLLAGRSDVSPAELRNLSKSSVDRIRMRVAENERTPVDVLSALASDESVDVRAAVALNASTPKAVLKRLAMDNDPSVRYSIAEDPNMRRDILLQLSDDANAYVAVRARRTLELQGCNSPDRIERTLAGRGILKMIKGALNLRRDTLRFA